MNPSVINVEPEDDFKLALTFENGEKRVFDVTPCLDKGIFTELKNINYFRRVRVVFGALEWPHEQDFSNDTLYPLGK